MIHWRRHNARLDAWRLQGHVLKVTCVKIASLRLSLYYKVSIHNNCENIVLLYSNFFCKRGIIHYYIEKIKTSEFQEMLIATACCICIQVIDNTVHVSAWHSTCCIRTMYVACVLQQLHNPCWTWPSSTKSLSRQLAGSPTPHTLGLLGETMHWPNNLEFTLSPLVFWQYPMVNLNLTVTSWENTIYNGD